MDQDSSQDICRVCRCEASTDRPLFYPCVCTGSIKYIHQDCLTQWLRYSRKEYCELCNHRFSFTPIYAPDMPKRLPIRDLIYGLLSSVGTAFRFWFHYTLVAFAWLGVVPLSACRIHRSLFTGSVSSILSLPLDLLSTENIVMDIFHGCVVVMCALSVFISLIWLREHIMQGGGPEWLMDQPAENMDVPEPDVLEDDNGNEAGLDENAGVGNGIGGDGVGLQAPRARRVVEPRDRVNEDLNWPMDWDRAGEELTWEKLLGLDGSLLFLEHVFWVVSLNTLCILVFEFSPYHIGYFSLAALNLHEWTQWAHFEGLLTTLVGYLIIGISLVLLHTGATALSFRKSRKIFGISYVVVKVCLLSVVEIGIFPLVCGWWLDICSLPLFDATLKDREASFIKAPGTCMFMHWLFGMVYVFYFASFILLLREVLRPGVLWFMRNLNDPDFNPIQEMIHLPILKHLRRFLFSIIIFGTTTLLMVWIPVRIIKRFWPGFLPYSFAFTTESTHEMSLELVLLQVMMPALLEQGHTREWIKSLIRAWCICLSWVLDFRSYLLGDVQLGQNERIPVPQQEPALNVNPEDPENEDVDTEDEGYDDQEQDVDGAPVEENVGNVDDVALAPGLGFIAINGGLGAAHQALILRGGPTGDYPYHRPNYFHFKIFILILSLCITLSIVSLGVLTVPVGIGRLVMGYSVQTKGEPIHELYTTATGLYVTWLTVRLFLLLGTWIPKGWAAVWRTVKKWSVTVSALNAEKNRLIPKLRLFLLQISKTVIAMGLLIGVIPYLSGLLFELVIITPIRIPITSSPIHMYSENWVMGTLYIKIACASIMMSPQHFWLRRTLERIYNNGIRNINLNMIIRELAAPCIVGLGLALTVPYVISQSIIPIFVTNLETQNMVQRRIYPFLLVLAVSYGIILFQVRQFTKLYEHIKNDKYLVGRRLVNYERPPTAATTAATAALPVNS